MNLEDRKLEASVKAESFSLEGDYQTIGGVYELPLSSSGKFSIVMSDVTFTWIIYMGRTDDNNNFTHAKRLIVDVSPANVAYRFDKQFDGDNNLGEAIDDFMNENSMEIFNDVKPQLMKILGFIFQDMANVVFSSLPVRSIVTFA